MKAIILAAGLGTRLRPMTDNTPKALIKVKDKPLVEYQIEFLKEKGIDEIIVVVGYLHEQFDYLKEKHYFGLPKFKEWWDKADYDEYYVRQCEYEGSCGTGYHPLSEKEWKKRNNK